MIDTYVERFEHPYLLLLIPISFVLLVLGFGAQAAGMDFRAAFLGLFAIGGVIICGIGYTAFGILRFSTQTLQWWRVRNGDEEHNPTATK